MKLCLALMSLSDGAARSLAKSAVIENAKAKLMAAVSKSKAVLMSLAFGLSLSVPALASDSSSSSSSDMTALLNATDTISSMITKVWNIMLANPLLSVFTAGSLLSMGIGFFMYLKKAARH